MPSPCCQHVFQRTAVVVKENGDIDIRFTVGLPARGRTILGQTAAEILLKTLPKMIENIVLYKSYSAALKGNN